MLSSLTRSSIRCCRQQQHRIFNVAVAKTCCRPSSTLSLDKLFVPQMKVVASTTNTTTMRYFSSSDNNDTTNNQSLLEPIPFKPNPPDKITKTMAEGIQDTTLFYLRNGVSHQRLKDLALDDAKLPLVQKWQKMMEIYLSTQVYVLAGLGYSGMYDNRDIIIYYLYC